MLTRKPKVGDMVKYDRPDYFTAKVTRIEGNICHTVLSSGEHDLFIWHFDSDNSLNTCFTILEKT